LWNKIIQKLDLFKNFAIKKLQKKRDGRIVAGGNLIPIQRLLSLFILKYKTGKEKW